MTSTHAGTSYRPDRMVLVSAGWRAALVVVAALLVAFDAPAWLRLPFSTAAALATATFFIQRYRRRGVLDTWLTAVGAGIVLLALLGLLLNVFPAGLGDVSWAVGVGAAQLILLGAMAFLRAPAATRGLPISRRTVVVAVGWSAAVLGVLSGAVIWSAASFSATHIPPLAMEAETRGNSTVITITSGRNEGPYRLDLVTDDGRTTLASGIRVGPGRPATDTVRIAADSRALVQLVPAEGYAPTRELILDSTAAPGTR